MIASSRWLGFVRGQVGWFLMLFACGETEECQKLSALLPEFQRVAQMARSRAHVTRRLEASLTESEAATEAYLDKLGLNDSEGETQGLLEERVAKIPDAKIVRGTWKADSTSPVAETLWRITFPAKTLALAVEQVNGLLDGLPLVLWMTLIFEKDANTWRLELVRARVERVQIKPEPTPLPKLSDPATIESKIGFCGADVARKELSVLAQEIAGLQANAERTTVLLPSIATWKGLLARAEILDKREKETRRLIKIFLDAAVSAGVPFKAAGFEDPSVILEVMGGPPERAKLDARLGPVLQEVKVPPVGAPGVVRLALDNAIALQAGKAREAQRSQPELSIDEALRRASTATPSDSNTPPSAP